MMFIDFAAGGKEYKLRLNTRGLITLEKDLGFNPIELFGIGEKPVNPSLENMLKVFKASLKPYHEIKDDEIYSIFDAWLEDGHITTEFISVIVEVYKVSGLIKQTKN